MSTTSSRYPTADDLRFAVAYLRTSPAFDTARTAEQLDTLADDIDAGRVRLVQTRLAVPEEWRPSMEWFPYRTGERSEYRVFKHGKSIAGVWPDGGEWWLDDDAATHGECDGYRHGQYLAEQALGAAHDK